MFRFLMPKETEFFDFFEEHCSLIIEAGRELVALCEPGADIQAKITRIAELEHQTDGLTHRCIHALRQTFITPFDRNLIHELIKGLDDIIDTIDDASSKLAVYEITEIRPELKQMAVIILESCTAIHEAIRQMRNLKNEPAIKRMVIAVHRHENDADAILRASIKQLFKESEDLKYVIQWKEILEEMEEATDRCEDVADIIQGIIIEAS